MNAATFRKLLEARRLDLRDNERDIRKYRTKLVDLLEERMQIMDDIDGLNLRLYAKGERNIDEK